MRMWMIEPKLLCDQHLLGEHGEIHKHRHVFEKQQSITGRVEKDFPDIEPDRMEYRHHELALEMKERGFNHLSPYECPDLNYLSPSHRMARANIFHNLADLCKRCPDCKQRIMEALGNE